MLSVGCMSSPLHPLVFFFGFIQLICVSSAGLLLLLNIHGLYQLYRYCVPSVYTYSAWLRLSATDGDFAMHCQQSSRRPT